MKIGIVQLDVVWGNPDQNIEKIEQLIETRLQDSDIVILPEMFSTGFSMKPERVAEDFNTSSTLRWMRSAAKRYDKAIVGSVAICDNGEYYNRLFFVFDDGSYRYYDKRHLFRMAGEHKVYSAGDNRLIIDYKGVRFMPLVCYDLRFPVWSRSVDNEYDVVIYIASWPDKRVYAWDTLLKARAIENIAYSVGVNRVGDDKANHYSGHSAIYNYLGEEIALCANQTEEAISVEIDMDRLRLFREGFPAHLDRDNFTIN